MVSCRILKIRCVLPGAGLGPTATEAVIKNADMAEDMQQDAIDSATQALEKYNIEHLARAKSWGWRPGDADVDPPQGWFTTRCMSDVCGPCVRKDM